MYLVVLLAEHEEDYQCADKCARLNDPEHAGLALVNEEVGEIKVCRLGEQNRSRVADKSRRTLEVRRNGDADNARDRGDVELLAQCKCDGCYHKNGSDIVNERGDDSREKAHADDSPLDIGHLRYKNVTHQLRHLGLDKEIDSAHGAGYHHNDVPVDFADSCFESIAERVSRTEGEKVRTEKIGLECGNSAEDNEDNCRCNSDIGADLLKRHHKNIRRREEHQCGYSDTAHASHSKIFFSQRTLSDRFFPKENALPTGARNRHFILSMATQKPHCFNLK